MDAHDSEHDDAGIEALDHVPQPNGRLTGATVATVRGRLLKDGLLFRLDDEGIARHFAQAFFNGNAFKTDLKVLRNVVSSLEGCPEDVPSDPKEFSRWVRTELLEFEHLPRDTLATLYAEASTDLASIESNISHCRASIIAIEKRDPKTETDNLDTGFFNYFLAQNSSAKNEIIAVLTNGIQREALRRAYGRLFPWMVDWHVPWSFRWRPESYSATKYSAVAHAFLALGQREFFRIQELYQQKRWVEFDTAMNAYIRDYASPSKISCLLDSHHLLVARREVLVPALNSYERGELALFASAVAVQIEGIFEDACHLSDVPHTELRIATLVPKLNALRSKGNVDIDYPYYAFKFPALRNRVAHGRMVQNDLERTARLLLLDLRNACDIVCEHQGPTNAQVTLLRKKAGICMTVADAIEFAILFAETEGRAPDKFYALAHEFEQMTNSLHQPRPWLFLERLAGVNRDELDAGLRFIASRLHKRFPAAKQLFTKLGARGDGPLDRIEFVQNVRAFDGHDQLAHDDSEIRGAFLHVLKARCATGTIAQD